jgi:phytoene synthase
MLDPDALIELMDAREAETEEGGFATEQDFVTWLRGTAGGWSAVAGRALGADAQAAEVLRALGAAYGLAGVLRSVAAHAAQGRCLLPRDRLAEAGLRAEHVITDPRGAALAALLRMMAQEGLDALATARRDVPSGAIAAALPAVLARRDLRRLARGRAAETRGIGDRLAVTWAGLRQRV